MIFIVYILSAIFAIVYYASRSVRTTVPSKKRIALFACTLAFAMVAQTFYLVTKPPKVDYYETGWYGFIIYLNAGFASHGISNRIPLPETQ